MILKGRAQKKSKLIKANNFPRYIPVPWLPKTHLPSYCAHVLVCIISNIQTVIPVEIYMSHATQKTVLKFFLIIPLPCNPVMLNSDSGIGIDSGITQFFLLEL